MTHLLTAPLLALSLLAAGLPGTIYDDGLVVGACTKNGDCVIGVPSGCCTMCSGAPVAVLKGHGTSPECGCGMTPPRPGDPACAVHPPASAFRAVCKKQRCVKVPAAIKK